jgi:hypothetical protein
MAHTLTYDPSSDPDVLSEQESAEQESYEIGERLSQEQDNLLAGKYRDAAELEQGYLELQRMLGQRGQDQSQSEYEEEEPQYEEEPTQEEEVQEEIDPALVDQIYEEYEAGEFSAETLQALDQLTNAEVAELIAAGRREQSADQEYAISQEDVNELKSIVGGETEYANITAWAAENLTPQEIEVYDAVMDQGDPRAIYFAIQALNYRYRDSVGTEGNLIQGRAPRGGESFRSMAELVRAQSDPRYDNDPAYRADVLAKLERSGDLL